MSDLPSRERVRYRAKIWQGMWQGEDLNWPEITVALAYADGRLIDREAIDYEAAVEEWQNGRPGVGPVTDRLCVQRIVDAALGVGSDPQTM